MTNGNILSFLREDVGMYTALFAAAVLLTVSIGMMVRQNDRRRKRIEENRKRDRFLLELSLGSESYVPDIIPLIREHT